MALQGYIKTADGVEHPDAYAKIARLELDYLASEARLVVPIWHNRDTRLSDYTPVLTREYHLVNIVPDDWPMGTIYPTFTNVFGDDLLTAPGATFRGQAYAFLKSKPEWAGWLDIQ